MWFYLPDWFTWGMLFYFRGSSGIKIFSNCSMQDYRYFISKLEAKCLQNLPKLQPSYQNQSVCFNGILEPDEECDCGSEAVSNIQTEIWAQFFVFSVSCCHGICRMICSYVPHIELRYENEDEICQSLSHPSSVEKTNESWKFGLHTLFPIMPAERFLTI